MTSIDARAHVVAVRKRRRRWTPLMMGMVAALARGTIQVPLVCAFSIRNSYSPRRPSSRPYGSAGLERSVATSPDATAAEAITESISTPPIRPQATTQSQSSSTSSSASSDSSTATVATSSSIVPLRVPRHIAIVCDGNARWAKQRGLPAVAGHMAGAERLVQVLQALQRDHHHDGAGVTHCTVYGFSTENWQRSAREIADIFHVMERTVRKFHDQFLNNNVILKVIGDLDDARIPQSLRDSLRQLEEATQSKHDSAAGTPNVVTLCLAINYGGRQDILNASRRLATLIASGAVDANDITEASIASLLDTADLPYPDLWIRTSGECRLSNFMLWDAAYAELYFTETQWPDFDARALQTALDWYAQRDRRFGRRS